MSSRSYSMSAADLMAKRLKGKLPGKKYQSMDYGALKEQLASHRAAGKAKAHKIQSMQRSQQEQDDHEKTLLHKRVWLTEHAKYRAVAQAASSSTMAFFDEQADASLSEHFLSALVEHNQRCDETDTLFANEQIDVMDLQDAAKQALRDHRRIGSALHKTSMEPRSGNRGGERNFHRMSTSADARRARKHAALGLTPESVQESVQTAFDALQAKQHFHAQTLDELAVEEELLFRELEYAGCVVGPNLVCPTRWLYQPSSHAEAAADNVEALQKLSAVSRENGDEDGDEDDEVLPQSREGSSQSRESLRPLETLSPINLQGPSPPPSPSPLEAPTSSAEHATVELADTPRVIYDFKQFEDAWRLDFEAVVEACGDEALANHLTVAFEESLSNCYERLVDAFNTYNENASIPFGNWSPRDHFLFEVIQHSYNGIKLPPRLRLSGVSPRQLGFAMMQKVVPSLTRNDLVDHEAWLSMCDFYAKLQRDVVQSNVREMKAALDDIREVLLAEMARQEEERLKMKEMAQRQERQIHLVSELLRLRQLRMERMRLEMEENERKQRKMNERQEKEQRRERHHRDKIAASLQQYHSAKAVQKKQDVTMQKALKQRAEEIRQQEAALHERRVKFRRRKQQEKLDDMAAQKERGIEELELREARLEALRQQVRPTIKDDPGRLYRPTVAREQAVADAIQQRRWNEMMPTVGVVGYDDKTITSDRRFKLSEALRKAGLEGTAYARNAFGAMKGSRQERPDAKTTLYQPNHAFSSS